MPYAINPDDGVRTWFEDWGGDGWPVLVYTGLADPLEQAQQNPLVNALAPDHRMIFADHRGHGRSDKPHDDNAYAMATRVADAVAVLDEAGVLRAHFLGFSWGARLGFGVGEQAPDRVMSLVLCGNQPYEWDQRWHFVQMLSASLNTTQDGGMQSFVDELESSFGERLEDPVRGWVLANDAAAISAAWRSAMSEGPISSDLTMWDLPCLIYMAAGEEMYNSAARAAGEIPGPGSSGLRGIPTFRRRTKWRRCYLPSWNCSTAHGTDAGASIAVQEGASIARRMESAGGASIGCRYPQKPGRSGCPARRPWIAVCRK